MTDYKPGTVAKATVGGVPNWTVFKVRHGWHTSDGPWFANKLVTDVRPLVVLDLDGVNRSELVANLRIVGLRDIADQIEEQTRPAIEEPTGLGAVVEVDGGVRFVRTHRGMWSSEDEYQPWENLNAVRVLSEGVRP